MITAARLFDGICFTKMNLIHTRKLNTDCTPPDLTNLFVPNSGEDGNLKPTESGQHAEKNRVQEREFM